jgi:hypothetical protein
MNSIETARDELQAAIPKEYTLTEALALLMVDLYGKETPTTTNNLR